MHICGVRVDEVTREEARRTIQKFLSGDGQYAVFTPNPEMVVAAQGDRMFLNVINRGALNICDGKGIELVTKNTVERIPGIDFLHDICRVAAAGGQSIFLLGGGEREVVEKAAEELRRLYPELRVAGTHPGPKINNIPNEPLHPPEGNDELMGQIIQSGPNILFVGFGHGKQEKWIEQFLRELPSVKVAMGVGGAFDVLAGKVRRAPALWRRVGMEWLWRLLVQPWRLLRIWSAVVIFLYYALFRLKKKSV